MTSQTATALRERAQALWLLVGIGTIFYLLVHTLQTIFLGVPSEFAGKEHQAVWGFSVLIGVMLLPVLISFLGASAAVAKLVLVLGLVGNLIMILAAWQYGVRASAGYITLVIAVFVLLPQGLALWRTFQWVRA